MKKILLFIAIFAVSLNMQAQEKMFVWQNGVKTDFVVTDVDSITFNQLTGNGHEYVDLGLPSGTLWATCNVGANKPEEYGDYFAWGEIEPKDEYSDYTYEWLDIRYETLTKYCINKNEGSVDNRTTLESCDDAAAANWGGNWRMPTNEEQLELINFCTYIWTTKNGISGYELTSKINGKSIFLPAAGSATTQVMLEGIIGHYWSCSLSKTFSKKAYCLTFMSEGAIFADEYTQQNRYEGASVRPITSLNQLYKSSQGEMHIWQNGGKTTFVVADVDSVTFSDSNLTNPTTPNGGIGVFSVSPDKQVTFSKGNLQYTRSTDTWSFASTQWEVIGTDNVTGGSVSSCEYGDMKGGTALADEVDLFGWSTSSTNFGVSTSTDNNDYLGSFVDWGTNKIGNDAPNTWRTLTYDEWYYLLNNRPNASSLKGVAQVNGVNGLIFLPDNWTCPAGVTFKSGFFHHSNEGVDYYAAYQTFTAEQWSKLEAAGAVFLPATGSRLCSVVSDVQFFGDYWSATENGSDDARYFYFYLGEAGMFHAYRKHGLSVRLVKDL